MKPPARETCIFGDVHCHGGLNGNMFTDQWRFTYGYPSIKYDKISNLIAISPEVNLPTLNQSKHFLLVAICRWWDLAGGTASSGRLGPRGPASRFRPSPDLARTSQVSELV